MAPSPTPAKPSTPAAPKTPTKLTRRPGQTPQKPSSAAATSASSNRPAPSTPKPAQAMKPESASSPIPSRPEAGAKAQTASANVASQAEKGAEGAGDQALQTRSKVGMTDTGNDNDDVVGDGDDDDDDDDDDNADGRPLDKVRATGKQAQEGLEEAAPEPIPEDDEREPDGDNGDAVQGARADDDAEDVADDATEKAGETVRSADDEGEQTEDSGTGARADADEVAGKATDKTSNALGKNVSEPDAKGAKNGVVDEAAKEQDLPSAVENGVDEGKKVAGDADEDAATITGEVADDAEAGAAEGEAGAEPATDAATNLPDGLPIDLSVLRGLEVEEDGTVYDGSGNAIGRLAEGDAEDLAGYPIGDDGEILDDDGDLVGRVELLPGAVREQLLRARDQGEELPEAADEFLSRYEEDVDDQPHLPPLSILQGLTCQVDGLVYDADGNTVGRVVEGDPQELQHAVLDEHGQFVDEEGNVVGSAEVHDDAEELVAQGVYESREQVAEQQGAEEEGEQQADGLPAEEEDGVAKEQEGDEIAEPAAEIEDQLPGIEALQGRELNEAGEVFDEEGNLLGGVAEADDSLRQQLAEGQLDPRELQIDAEGNVLDAEGNVLGRTELAAAATEQPSLDLRILDGKRINKSGKILDDDGEAIGELVEGELAQCVGARANDHGQVINRAGEVVGRVQVVPGEAAENATRELLEELGETPEEEVEQEEEVQQQEEEEEEEEPRYEEPDISILDGLKVNKKGQVLDEDGEPIGELTAGDIAQCAGKKINAVGEVLDRDGNVIGHVRTLPQQIPLEAEEETPEEEQQAPPVSLLEGFKVNKKGQVLNEDGEPIGELATGDPATCAGKKINADGDVLDEQGNVVGSVRTLPTAQEDAEEEAAGAGEEEEEEGDEEEGEQLPPLSILEGLAVNKAGKLIDDTGAVVGELVEGDAKKLSRSGVTADAEGQFWDDKGHVVGRARTLPQEAAEEEAPFAGLTGLRVVDDGWVQDDESNTVGYLTEGDAAKLLGRVVDEDGDVLDAKGSVIGHAERYVPEEEEEPEQEQPADLSFLKGKTITKSGLLIGDEGIPVARLVEGNAKELAGRQLDDQGQFWNDQGSVLGRVELIPEAEREAKPEGPFAGLDDLRVVEGGKVADEDGNVVGEITEGNAKRLLGLSVDEDGDIVDKYGTVKGHAEPLPDEEPVDYTVLDGLMLNKQGYVVDESGTPVGRIVEGNAAELAGRKTDENGYLYNDTGKVVGRCEPLPEEERVRRAEGVFAGLEGLHVIAEGRVADENDNVVGQIVEGEAKKLLGMHVDEDGDIIDKFGNVKGRAERLEEEEEEAIDYSILDGLTLNKQGYVVDANGIPFGRITEGNAADLAGRQCDEQGYIYNDRGKAVARCTPLDESERVARPEGPFAGLEGLRVIADGKVADESGNVVGEIVEGEGKRLIGMKVDEDGDIIDRYGNTKGHAEPLPEQEETPVDNSALDGKYLNKQGYVVDDRGIPFGRLVEGNVSELAGRKCDENGYIYGDTGKVVGRCEVLPENERVARPEGPFAGLEGLRVVQGGFVEDEDGNRVGQLVEGDQKRLVGLHVDEDGDIIDKYGNVKGHAEPWQEEEAEAVDLSRLAGTSINKAGYAVDGSGTIIGRVVEGDPNIMIGKKVDAQGQIWDDAGNVIGRCDIAQGIGGPEGPFAGFEGLQINKDGTVTTPAGDVVGRIVEGDIRKLLGHTVDEDGEVTDKNGNTIGKAERWEPEEKERRINPMSGRRVNREGEVRDDNGELMGRLTMGDLGHCVGQEIDDAGNVVDVEGNKIGEVTLLENIAEEEYEGPSEEELEEARKREEERQVAEKMGAICTQTLERMQPICKQITEYMEKADATPKDELDEEELVNNVKPLIEEGGRILQECNGSLRGLDPDGRIAAQAKGRAGTGEATPEEYRLAETLKELTTTVVTTIDNAKKKLNNMPHAKRKLNPLWALLTQPLFQILAAVGLLLAGVLGLVGQLLNGLGLGGLVNGLLGGLGLNRLLASFGLIDDGKKKKGGKGEGQNKLASLPIVGGLFGGNGPSFGVGGGAKKTKDSVVEGAGKAADPIATATTAA